MPLPAISGCPLTPIRKMCPRDSTSSCKGECECEGEAEAEDEGVGVGEGEGEG